VVADLTLVVLVVDVHAQLLPDQLTLPLLWLARHLLLSLFVEQRKYS
jgi:prepilin signal peptidase PulO-like enzyme (type II secretory pathway)